MKEKLTELLKGKKGATLLFIGGIAAILCIFAGSFFTGDKSEKSPQKLPEFSEEEYLSRLEQEVSQLVYGICGDSDAIVTITLETGLVYEYADETKRGSATDKEKTSEESQKTYITVKEAEGGEVPLIITSYMPRVRGVAVICNAAEGETAEKIQEAVCSALDVTSRQIYIGRKMGNENG